MAKYIIFKERGGTQKLPIIFPELEDHSDICHLIENGLEAYKAVSAGFVCIEDGFVKPYGKSKSLNLSVAVGDNEILTSLLNEEPSI